MRLPPVRGEPESAGCPGRGWFAHGRASRSPPCACYGCPGPRRLHPVSLLALTILNIICVYVSVYLSVYLYHHLSTDSFTDPHTYLSICLCIDLSLCIHIYICTYLCHIYLHTYLSIYLTLFLVYLHIIHASLAIIKVNCRYRDNNSRFGFHALEF